MKSTAIKRKLAASFSPALSVRIKGLRQRIHVEGTTSVQFLSGFSPPQTDCMAAIFQAFLEMRELKETYLDVDENCSERTIEPRNLELHNPVWYLDAWDREKDAVRFFRCDRIQGVSLEETPFSERSYVFFESAITRMGEATI